AKIVPPQALTRVAGASPPPASPELKNHLESAGLQQQKIVVRLCISAEGRTSTVKIVQGSGVESYDYSLLAALKTWLFLPYEIDRWPTPVCTGMKLQVGI
ncbi:MAG: energy transducer TonB, partial [Myxococcota bacterium]